MLVRNIVIIVHRSAKIKDGKASGQANCCSVAPNPPPKGDQFPGNDVPGHATRLVATQQPDIALHQQGHAVLRTALAPAGLAIMAKLPLIDH